LRIPSLHVPLATLPALPPSPPPPPPPLPAVPALSTHTPASQLEVAQSEATLQLFPIAQRSQAPPQSMSLSPTP
jgi:hypothetical protein